MEVIFSNWPVYAFLFLVFFVLLFRTHLINLIGRIKSISTKGIDTSNAVEQQIKEQSVVIKKDENEKKPNEVFSDILLNAVVDNSTYLKKKEEQFTNELSKIKIAIGGKEPFLIKILAISWATNDCEVIYREILGSQIRMLIYLNGKQTIGKTHDELEPFYKQYSGGDENIENNYPYINYLAWMLWKELIELKEDKLIYISDKGKYFLNHIITKGYDVNKPS